MLDQQTKKRIDDCRNILVGKITDPKSQVEQITIALIYKFMDDMDTEAIEMGGVPTYFVGDYERYSWKNIFSPRIGGDEMLSLYGEGMVKMNQNPNLPQLFRDIFKNAYLPYRDPETLKLFLKTINEFNYDHSERLGDAFEYLLSVLGSQGDAGQFRTPRHIIDFIVQILDPKKNETCLDPSCGTSGFLISSYKHIINSNTNKFPGDKLTPDERKKLMNNVTGYDISPDMVRLSLVNLFLHGFSNPKVYEYDTLTSEDRWNEYYDVVLANPPFMSPRGGIRPHKRFGIQSNRAEVLFVDYIMEHLTPKGRAGIVVPEGIIFQSGTAYKSLRKSLIEKYLVGVISLPSGVFNPYSGVKTSILVLDRELNQKTDKIFFVKVENDGFDLGAQRREIDRNDLPDVTNEVTDYLNGLRDGKSVKTNKLNFVSKGQILVSNDVGLNYERYTTKIDTSKTEFQLLKIGELVKIEYGTRIVKSKDSGSIYPVYGGGGETFKSDTYNREDRLIISRFAMSPNCVRLVKGKFFLNDSGFTIENIRKDILSTDYLNNILINIQDSIFKCGKGAAQKNINFDDFNDLKIPLPPLDVQEEIVQELEQYQKIIDGAKQVVDNYKPIFDIDPSWEMKELGELFTTSSGGTPLKSKNEYYENGTIPWLRSGEVNDGFIYSTELNITENGLKNSSAKIFPINSVLIAMYGATVGQVGITKIETSTNQAVCGVFPNKFYIPEFVYYYLKQKREELIKMSVGGAQPNISQGIIKSILIPVIELKDQQSIVERIESERQIIEGNKKLIEIYTQKIQDRINKIWGVS